MSLPAASPCIGVCRMDDASGWCVGCLRTLDEIALWSQWGDGDKRAVWLALGARRVQWRRLHRVGSGDDGDHGDSGDSGDSGRRRAPPGAGPA